MEWIELKRKNIAILKGIWLIMISMDLPLTASFKQNLWLNTAPLEGMWFDIRRWPGTERTFVKNWMKENSKPSRLFSGENKLDWELIQKGEDVMICLLWRRYPKWILYANSVSSMFLLRHSEEIPYEKILEKLSFLVQINTKNHPVTEKIWVRVLKYVENNGKLLKVMKNGV